MVDSSSSGSPRVDANAYPLLQETIQNLGRGYRMGNVSFDKSSSNFARSVEHPVIPGIHVPLQIDDRASRDILYCRSDSSDGEAEQHQHASGQEVKQTKRTATGAQASTSTSAGPPEDMPRDGEAEAPPRPLRDVDANHPWTNVVQPLLR